MKLRQALDWVGATLFVCYLNTLIVWLWPDLSLWAFGVVLVLGVVFVAYVYRTTRKAVPQDSENQAGRESQAFAYRAKVSDVLVAQVGR